MSLRVRERFFWALERIRLEDLVCLPMVRENELVSWEVSYFHCLGELMVIVDHVADLKGVRK